jgi:hypothetical protein
MAKWRISWLYYKSTEGTIPGCTGTILPIPNPICISTTFIVRNNPIYDVVLVHTSQQHNTGVSAPIQSTIGATAQVEPNINTISYT